MSEKGEESNLCKIKLNFVLEFDKKGRVLVYKKNKSMTKLLQLKQEEPIQLEKGGGVKFR